ncbi:unnamed protein product [Paramecium octaurelia]|uniref:Uncharacterized protein n=1 Tax=Paramecium octaurelia TaxID=43137 RepID=A0A8S1YFZ1_PAROT|nr:unnamed protein product [Paramecium octaurelia]
MSQTKLKIESQPKECDVISFKNLCFANNYAVEIYLLLLSFSNLAYYIFNESSSQFMLVKFILTSCLTLIAIALQKRLDPNIARFIKFICELVSISQLIQQDEWNCLAILSLIFDKGILLKNQEIYNYLYDYLILKILGLTYVSLYWNNQVFIIIICNSIVLEIYQILLMYVTNKQTQQQKLETFQKRFSVSSQKINSENINLVDNQMKNEEITKNDIFMKFQDQNNNENLINTEDHWIKRMHAIPISIIILSKKTLTIKFKNETARKNFNTLCYNDDEINDLIMNKLEFTLLEDNLEILKNSSSIIIRKQFLNKPVNQSYSSQFDMENLKKLTLSKISQNFLKGDYHNLMKPNTNSIDLYCHQILDSQQFQINGTIFYSNGDDELTIILSDISKQMQLQQFIVKDEFQKKVIESLSHELKTPLNSSINFIKSAIADDQLPLCIKKQCLEPASIALQLQSYIINDVIDFSQFYNNTLDVCVKEFEIKDVISEITSIFNLQFQNKGLNFVIDLTKNTSTHMSTDYNRLMQILVNVIQNSLKYTYNGGAILKIKNQEDDVLSFSVSDTGIGIKSEMTKKLNTYVNQVENLRHFSKLKSWNGIGLLISSILLHQLNPQLTETFQIKSKLSEGTKFKFKIRQILIDDLNNNTDDISRRKSVKFKRNSKKNIQNNLVGTLIFVNESAFNTQNLGLSSKPRPNLNKKLKGSTDYDQESYESDNNNQNLSDQYLQLQNQQHNFILNIIDKKKLSGSFEQQSIKSSSMKSKILSYTQLKIMERQSNDSALENFKKNLCCQCRRIMSVDDEIFNQNSIKLLIERYGFEVIISYNGVEAISIIKSLKKCSKECGLLNLILMDYSMPVMDGIQCTIQLKRMMKEKIIPNINIIGLTAFTSKLEVESCLNAGMLEVLFKPLKLTDFCELLTLL